MARVSDLRLGALWFVGFVLMSSFSSSIQASEFNDAVNLYLKGFDSCTSAKESLSQGKLKKASGAFANYQKVLDQAAKLDKTILTSSKRGMASNLKYCQRVGFDIELAQSQPLLEQAFAACELAGNQMKQGEVASAQEQYKQFTIHRDMALEVAPSIKDVFSIRSKIRLCERMEKKIANAGKKLAATTIALQSAQEASELFHVNCQATTDALSKSSLNKPALTYVDNMVSNVKSKQKEANKTLSALKSGSGESLPPEFKQISERNKKANVCLSSLNASLSEKKMNLQGIENSIATFQKQVNGAISQCTSVLKTKSVNKKQYDSARKQFQNARSTHKKVKNDIAKSKLPEGNAAKKLNNDVANLNQCLEKARPKLGKLLATIAVPVVSVPVASKSVPVKGKQEPKKAKVEKAQSDKAQSKKVASVSAQKKVWEPSNSVSGVLEINDIQPEFVVVYWLDDSKAKSQVDVEVYPTGFDKKLYFLAPSGRIKVNSNDFATHTVKASINGGDAVKTKVRSRQRKTLKTKWQANSVALLQSNQDRVEKSYIVSLNSNNPSVLYFEDNKETLKVELDNPKQAKKGYLLMPDYDPIPFEIGKDEETVVKVTRNGSVLGRLSLMGR